MNKLAIGNYGINDACNNERPFEDWSTPDYPNKAKVHQTASAPIPKMKYGNAINCQLY
jgi:hypothetical protein